MKSLARSVPSSVWINIHESGYCSVICLQDEALECLYKKAVGSLQFGACDIDSEC